jgi:hypothetical protein
MKTLALAILALSGILIRVFGCLPSKAEHTRTDKTVRPGFLLAVGFSMMGLVFIWFWLVMRAR